MKKLIETKNSYRTKILSRINSGAKTCLTFALFLVIATLAQSQNIGPFEITTAGGYGEKNLKKAPRKVYIAEFRVMYQLMYHQTDVDKGGRTLGGGLRGDTKASVTLGLKGVDVPDIQEITDKLYTEYTVKLKEQGFELVTADEASKTETLAGWEMKTGGQANEAQFKGFLMTTPTSYSYLIKRTADSGKEKKGFLENSPKISRDLGGAIVAKINIVVPMVEDAESAGSKMLKDAAGGIAKVVLRPALRIENEAIASGNATSDFTTTSGKYYYMKSMGEQGIFLTALKNPVEISGVLPDKKYKATATANSDIWGTNAGYFTIFSVTNEMIANMQAIECDRNQYVNGVSEAAGKFLNASLAELFNNSK